MVKKATRIFLVLLLIQLCLSGCDTKESDNGLAEVYTEDSSGITNETVVNDAKDNLIEMYKQDDSQYRDANKTGSIDDPYLHIIGLYGRYNENTNERYPDYYDLFDTKNSLESMKSFFQDVTNEYDYLVFMDQFLAYEDYYDGDDKFVYGYGFLSEQAIRSIVNQHVKLEDGTDYMYTQISTAHMGQNLSLYYDDSIFEGNNFSEGDFNKKGPESSISVILGYDYYDSHSVGDVLESFSLHGTSVSLHVIGFFKPDTSIRVFGHDLDLDTHIVLPFYDISYAPVNEADEAYQKIYYSQKLDALMIKIPALDIDNKDVLVGVNKKAIDDFASKYNLMYTLSSELAEIIIN